MSWTNCKQIEIWNGNTITIGLDSDGDIGIQDRRGYSIVLSPKGATELMNWIREHVPEPPEPTP